MIDPPSIIALAAAVALAVAAAGPSVADGVRIERGIASQYAPGVMQTVIRNRKGMGHLPDPLPDANGFIAVRD